MTMAMTMIVAGMGMGFMRMSVVIVIVGHGLISVQAGRFTMSCSLRFWLPASSKFEGSSHAS
jgi:hypothetical protein